MKRNAIEFARNAKTPETATTARHSIGIPRIIRLIVIPYYARVLECVNQAHSYARCMRIAAGIAIIIAGGGS